MKGAKECVEGAKARILEIVRDLEDQVQMEVVIPQKHHRVVMGARGSNVQGITTQFEVQIKFPERDLGQNQNQGQSHMANGEEEGHQVNGETAEEGAPPPTRPQDIVRIIGKKDQCEAARDALLASVPVSQEVEVPFKHHRYIIGPKGERVRQMMNEYDVSINVPPAQEHSDVIRITGLPANVERAQEALKEKVQQLEEEEVDRKARSFQLRLEVDPEYHSKIIGKRGAVITKIRERNEVNIQFPPRGDNEENIITITGYEGNVHKAKDEILAITQELNSRVKESIEIDNRIHSRLIGTRGRAIRKVMDDYKVRK